MTFDEIRLPLKVLYGSAGGPQFRTEVVTLPNGREQRNQVWSQARRVFDARTGLQSPADLAVLVAFFQARAGRARGFRLRDGTDFSSAPDGRSAPRGNDQPLGTGDGSTVTFQLVKRYPGGKEPIPRPIRKPVPGSVIVARDGVLQTTGWSVDTTTGVVTFATPPAEGQILTAGFLFDVPVRFDTDRLAITSHDDAQGSAPIPLIEVRG